MDPLASLGPDRITAFFLVLARIGPLFVLAPLFSSKSIPARAKGVAAVAIAVGLTPVALRGGSTVPSDVFELTGLLGKEILVGTAFAYALATLFAALAVAGSLVDTLVGFSFGGLVDPLTGNQSSVLAQLYLMVATMLLLAVGGDAMILQGLARTYELIPLTEAPQVTSLVAGAQAAFATVFIFAVQVAAPLVLALVLTDAAFGVVSKVVPQLNVFAVGFPAKVTVALVLVGVSLPFTATWLGDEFQRSLRDALLMMRSAG